MSLYTLRKVYIPLRSPGTRSWNFAMSQQSADKFLQGQMLLATLKEILLKPAKQ